MNKRSKEAQAFLDDIKKVYEKHSLCLGHEDGHGNFMIHSLQKVYVDWLMNGAYEDYE